MTKSFVFPTACQWKPGCDEAGTVQPKRWNGCFCEFHGQVYERIIGPGLVELISRFAADCRAKYRKAA